LATKSLGGSIKFIEELSMNAWPSLQTILYDGWILRFSGSYTKRANSVNPLYNGELDPAEKISECERLYSERKMDAIFKMTGASRPRALDALLSERGYEYQGETSIQMLNIEEDNDRPSNPAKKKAVFLSEEFSEKWLSSYFEMNTVDENKRQIAKQMLENTLPRKCLASISDSNNTIVACGLAVSQRGYVGLFDIVTHRNYRRRGLARQLTLELLNWGKLSGAKTAYLQVVLGNEPAMKLYQDLGFAECYRYWYRVKRMQ
jgi:N-acetylglutamate synthase